MHIYPYKHIRAQNEELCSLAWRWGRTDSIHRTPSLLPLSQTLSYGDVDRHIQKPRNFSPRMRHLAVAMDKTLVPASEQEQPEGLLSPLASSLCPLEVQELISGPRFPSLPEHLDSVPKQLEFQRHGSDPGFTRS